MKTPPPIPPSQRGPAWYAVFGAILGAHHQSQIAPMHSVSGPFQFGRQIDESDHVGKAVRFADITQRQLEALDMLDALARVESA